VTIAVKTGSFRAQGLWKDPFTVPAAITHQPFHDIVTVGRLSVRNTVV
jgi:hypothetical protein